MANQNHRKGYRECPSLSQQEVYNEKCEKTGYRTTSIIDMKSGREKQLHIQSFTVLLKMASYQTDTPFLWAQI